MDLIRLYFPTLTDKQYAQLEALKPLYTEWNDRINVVSRKDIENLYERHVLHSLSIAKWVQFVPATKVMDLGTGGGFPGVPLAIVFPESRFHLVDSIAKKLNVIEAVKEAIGLNNVFTFHNRAEQMPYQYDFVVTRAVAPLADLLKWTKGKYLPKNRNAIKNGLIALKGGDLQAEVASCGVTQVKLESLSQFYAEPFFADKHLVYVPRS